MDRQVKDKLTALHTRIAPRFARPEVRARAERYLVGLLEEVGRRNGWQMAEQIGENRPDGVQRLLNKARWDAELIRDDLRNYVVERIGHLDGVLVITEAGFPKKGTKSVGLAQQLNPSTGQEENCQVGIFLAYASACGWAFIDRALYLPEEWAENASRRRDAGVPEKVRYAPKGEVARVMLERTFGAEVPAVWVTGGAVIGQDERVQRWLRARGQPYVLPAMRANKLLPGAREVLPQNLKWAEVGAGSETTRPFRWAYGAVSNEAATGRTLWLLVRRSIQQTDHYVYYRAYGPRKTPLSKLVQVASTRRAVGEGIEQARGEVGLDQYEVRRWDAWHRHVTLCLLAHAALQVTRAER